MENPVFCLQHMIFPVYVKKKSEFLAAVITSQHPSLNTSAHPVRTQQGFLSRWEHVQMKVVIVEF